MRYAMRCKTLFSLSSMRHRYASKVEKPLRAPVCFFIEHVRSHDAYVKTYNDITSSCFARNIKDSKIQRCDDNENAHALPSLHLKKKRDCSQFISFSYGCGREEDQGSSLLPPPSWKTRRHWDEVEDSDDIITLLIINFHLRVI